MSVVDPAQDPTTELDEHPQDGDVQDLRVPLGRVLDWLRVLAGRRGHARVRWSGAGFVYTLNVERRTATVLSADVDLSIPTRDRRVILDRLTDALHGR